MNTPLFLDSNLIMYSLGAPHPLKEPCQKILEKIGSEEIHSITNIEVLQEILHRYFSIGKPDIAEIAYSSVIKLCVAILPVTLRETDLALELMKEIPSVTSRDAIHAATMMNNGIKEIISTDNHFDLMRRVRRIDPRKFRLGMEG